MITFANVPLDDLHLFLRGNAGTDEAMDNWIAWFEDRGVPHAIKHGYNGRRYLYKHQTRVQSEHLLLCCDEFDPAAEGRDLEAECRWTGLEMPKRKKGAA